MFSSARDMVLFLAANLGELPQERSLHDAMQLSHEDVLTIGPRNKQGLAWEVLNEAGETIVEKKGGLNNSSTYVGMIKSSKLGVAVLWNRGDQEAVEVGRRILIDLARLEPIRIYLSPSGLK